MPKLSADLLLVGVGRVVQILLALASMRVMTWCLSAGEVGHVYFILSVASYFSMVFLSPVGLYMTRRLHKWHEDARLPARFSYYNRYVIAVSLAAIPAVYAAQALFGVGAELPFLWLSLMVACFIYFGTWNSTFIPAINMLDHRRAFVMLSTATLAMNLIFSLGLVTYVRKSALLWIAGQNAGLLLLSIAAFIYLSRRVWVGNQPTAYEGPPARESLKGVYKFSLPLLLTSLFMWLQTQSYRIIVERNIGAEFLGMMAVGLGIAASIGAAAESLLQQVYYPIYYSEINTDDKERRKAAWQKMAGIMMPVYLLIMIFVSFFSKHLVTVLVDAKFRAAAFFTLFGAWIEFARITANILSSVAHSEMRTNYLAKPYVFGGIISAAGVFAATFMPAFRVLVPAALLAGGAATLYLMLLNMRRIMPLGIDRGSLLLAVLLSVPLAGGLFIPAAGIVASAGVLFAAGCYLAAALFFIYRRTVGAGKSGN